MTAGVFGCGPIGLLLVQALPAAGAETWSRPTRFRTAVPPPRRPAPRARRPARDRRGPLPGGLGVDVAFEAAGTDEALADAIAAVRPGGRVVLVGIPDGDRTSFTASSARRKGLTLAPLPADEAGATCPAAIDLAAAGRVDLGLLVGERHALAASGRRRSPRSSERRGLKVVVEPAARGGVSRERYAVGIDFGTESGRAVLVDCADGRELAHDRLPLPQRRDRRAAAGAARRRRARAGLGAPGSRGLLRTLQETVPPLLAETGVDPAEVVGIGIDFTSCTMLPTLADGTPLCQLDELRAEPHAWVKLWKHHAAQPEADRINAVAAERGETWLARYGGRYSSEWFFSKALQILDEAPEVYDAGRPADRGRRLDRLAADRAWRRATSCTAGYKAIWSKRDGFPADALLRRTRPALRARRRREDVAADRLDREPRRRAERARRGVDGPRARDSGRGRERRRARLRAGRRR